MSGFSYKDANGKLVQVPVRYGDMTRQVASIINKNSENVIPNAPFIACYIKDLKFDRTRMQDPTYVNNLRIRERALDENGNEYLNKQGLNYTVERLMPTPYNITFNSDIWTTNLDQKLQLWEQITVLFNPSMEIQTNNNYIDWTSLSYLEITDNSVFETRTVPQGVENNISIATLQFTGPAWITTPAKIKKLGIITKIISSIFDEPIGTGEIGGYEDALLGGDIFKDLTPIARIVITSSDCDLLVLNNTAVLVRTDEKNVSEGWLDVNSVSDRPSWLNLLDLHPGQFKSGLSELRFTKPDGNEIVAYISLNPTDESLMSLNIDKDTVPGNTILTDQSNTYSRGTIDAIVNPQTFNPNSVQGQNIDRRYLILEDININSYFGEGGYDGPDAWKGQNGDFQAHANDIIQWDGNNWSVLFDSTSITEFTYITNIYTGIQYKWDGRQWTKSYEGLYDKLNWRLIL
jgi:hypothetical protein